jgi:uncharacterized membrane protein YoaK (UPF0700 family)
MQRVTRMELAFLVVAALIASGIHTGTTTPDSPLRYLAVLVLGTAMGLRNATVRRLGFRDLPTTVATSTISDLASESSWGGGERRNQLRRIGAIGCMLVGAALGAIIIREVSVLAGFALAITAVLSALAHQAWIGHRHPGPAHAVQP